MDAIRFLTDLCLSTNASKSSSLVISPGNFAGGPYRRTERGGSKEVLRRHENLAGVRGMMETVQINGVSGWFGSVLETIFTGLPYFFQFNVGCKISHFLALN